MVFYRLSCDFRFDSIIVFVRLWASYNRPYYVDQVPPLTRTPKMINKMTSCRALDRSKSNFKCAAATFAATFTLIRVTLWGAIDCNCHSRSFPIPGTETIMDSCCRTHDLCPVKIRAYEAKYNITNNSLYTKWVWLRPILRCRLM